MSDDWSAGNFGSDFNILMSTLTLKIGSFLITSYPVLASLVRIHRPLFQKEYKQSFLAHLSRRLIGELIV